MTWSKKTLFSLLIGLDLLTNLLELAHVNFLYTTTLLSFCTNILLPGLLISLILRIKKISFWDNLLIVVGFGIAFLEFGGLLLNILLPLIGLKNPLEFLSLLIGFNIYILLLFIFAWLRTKQPVFQIPLLSCSKFEKVFYILPVFFPVLATLGAIVLNNGGSNILTLILLGAIAVYSFLLVLFRNKISSNLYPYTIFFIGLASLFTISLRGWYITGADVQTEYYVFRLTNAHHLWSMAFYRDPYNACLSITILPTVLTNLLSMPDMYVFKVIYQILCATTPVIVFLLMRKYTTPVFAFLSALFFIAFPTFSNDMPMANRQEIGFIFFGLALYMLLLSNFPLAIRKLLFVIFSLGVIVSHYSTNFVLLALVTFVFIFTFIISRSFMKNVLGWLLAKSHFKLKNTFPKIEFLSLPLIVLLFLMTFVWNNLYTNSSNHADSVIVEVISSLFVASNSDVSSSDLSYSIFFSPPKLDPEQQLQDYMNRIRQSENAGPDNLYSQSITSRYPTHLVPEEQLAPTPFGNWLSSLHIPVFNMQAELRSLSADFMQIFVFIGLLAILFFKQKKRCHTELCAMVYNEKVLNSVQPWPRSFSAKCNYTQFGMASKKPFDLEYLLLCFGALFLLVLITVLPTLSIEYGVLRMFQQLLFVLSLPIVIALSSILFFMNEQKRIIITCIVTVVFFLNLTGFISHLTGDYYPQMALDNSGSYFEAYYINKSDIIAIVWLSEHDVNGAPVESASASFQAYGGITTLNEIFPSTIRKNAYVYLVVSRNAVVVYDISTLIYNSPKSFLDDNKNLLYSNGQVNIYK